MDFRNNPVKSPSDKKRLWWNVCFLVSIVLYVTWLLHLLSYLHLAHKWPQLARNWVEVDLAMQKFYKYPPGLDLKFKIMTIATAFIAIGMPVRESKFLIELCFQGFE